MALNIDKNFKRSLHSTRPCGRSKAQTSFVKIPAAPAPMPAGYGETFYNLQDGEEEHTFITRKRKRGLLDIDLNALPQDDSPAEGINDQERWPTAVASVDSNSGEEKVNFQSECGSNFDGNGEDKEWRARRWKALLDVTEDAQSEYEEKHRQKKRKFQTQKQSENRATSREAELGSESLKRCAKKTTRDPRHKIRLVCSYDIEVAAEVVVAPPVVRSKRGRAVALPNKYRDSFVGPVVVEAEFPRQNRIGKSDTIGATYRKPR